VRRAEALDPLLSQVLPVPLGALQLLTRHVRVVALLRFCLHRLHLFLFFWTPCLRHVRRFSFWCG
jgi:hypothetical protein